MDKDESIGEMNEETKNLIEITIKFRGSSIPINLSVNSTIKDLKIILQPLTNLLPCCQKLIFAGKIMEDEKTLGLSKVKNGSKIYLTVSENWSEKMIIASHESIESEIKVTVHFKKNSRTFTVSLDLTIKELKILLQPLINILPRGQKLTYSGMVLEDEMTLISSGVEDGSEIYLTISENVHPGVSRSSKSEEAKRKMMEEGESSSEMNEENKNLIEITVIFREITYLINLFVNSTIKDLKIRLQPLTNILPRYQILICSGIILEDEKTLISSEVEFGSHIFLIASWGLNQGVSLSLESEEERKMDLIKITLRFGGRFIPINLSLDSTVRDLKILLQPLTNVLPRGQKLVFAAKILEDQNTLRLLGVKNGSGIMLIGTPDLQQGDGPIKEEPTASPEISSRPETNRDRKPICVKDRVERWTAGGVIGLSENGLQTIPDEVWSCGASIKVLILSHNEIQCVPPSIIQMTSLRKLSLDDNNISDDQLCWIELSELKSLTILTLSQNQLKSLPSALGLFTCLTQLDVANNELTCLPTEIGLLTNLEILKANNNRIITVPSCIGSCISLSEINLSSNLLVYLPETFSKLQNLKALYLNNNGLKCLPAMLLKLCTHLSSLDLHGTEITMGLLRKYEGWESFDERRRLKIQKQLDSGLGNFADFDEGADIC